MSAKFLVVDDHEDIRILVKEMLRSYGCECELAVDGQDALDKLQTPEQASSFDAILLDVMMPRLNGYQVLEKLKALDHTKSIPVIMLTAKGEGSEIMDGYIQGADYYIPKPFTREQIAYGLDIVFKEEEGSNQKVYEL